MKKYILIFFLIGIAGNAFAMKRNLFEEWREKKLEACGQEFSFSAIIGAKHSSTLKALIEESPTNEKYMVSEIKEDELPILKFLLDEMHKTQPTEYWSLARATVLNAHWNKQPSLNQIEKDAYDKAKSNNLDDQEAIKAGEKAKATAEAIAHSKPIKLLFSLTKKLKCNLDWVARLITENSLFKDLSDIAICHLLNEQIFDQNEKDYEAYKNSLLLPFIEKLTYRFKGISHLVEFEPIFLQFPRVAVDSLLDNENFLIDTENSLFTMVIIWINADQEHRAQDLLHLVKKIDYRKFTKYYLINIVGKVKNNFPCLTDFYKAALEYKNEEIIASFENLSLGKNNQNNFVQHKKIYKDSDKACGMKVEFRHISQWQQNQKYFSGRIFSNGYYFYFFLRPEKGQDEQEYLAAFLRCTCEQIIKDNDPHHNIPTHYLPVNFQVKIERPNGLRKIVGPNQCTFEYFSKSCGMHLNKSTENWKTTFVFNPTDPDLEKQKMVMEICVYFED